LARRRNFRLEGNLGRHHALLCRQIIDHLDFLDRSIATLTDEICARFVPLGPKATLLTSIPGISEVTAQVIVAETGADMTRFPTPGHLCAWAGVAPASYESAGKRRPAGTRQGSPYLRRTLIEAARSAARTTGSYYSARYVRIARRRGPNKAAVAVATGCSSAPGICSRPVPSTKTPVPTTSSVATILPERQSGSSAGSRPSGSPSPSPRRPHSHSRSETPVLTAPTGTWCRAPKCHYGIGTSGHM
jgi:hypothetical protein